MTMSRLTIRKATPGDLEDILTFLKQEYDEQSTKDGFSCNRDGIEQAQGRNELEVLVQPHDEKVLAFCVWSPHPTSMSIIEVRPGYRRKGLGRCLTQYVLDQLRGQDSIGVEIQCMPEESLLVWQRMGFQKIKKAGDAGVFAVYLFHATREFPKNAEIKTIDIRLTNCGKTSGPPLRCQGMVEGAKCVLQTDFVAYLSESVRTCGHEVEIYVDGRLTHLDLVKYSTDAGVEAEGNFLRCRALDMSNCKSNRY